MRRAHHLRRDKGDKWSRRPCVVSATVLRLPGTGIEWYGGRRLKTAFPAMCPKRAASGRGFHAKARFPSKALDRSRRGPGLPKTSGSAVGKRCREPSGSLSRATSSSGERGKKKKKAQLAGDPPRSKGAVSRLAKLWWRARIELERSGRAAQQRRRTPACARVHSGSVVAAIWLILPVVICLSQRLSHACLSSHCSTVKPRMAH